MRRSSSDIVGPGQLSTETGADSVFGEPEFGESSFRRQSASSESLESYSVGLSTFYTTGKLQKSRLILFTLNNYQFFQLQLVRFSRKYKGSDSKLA